MRTLKDAGLVSLPPFVKTPQLDGRVFEILSAIERPGYNAGTLEVVYTLRAIDGAGPLLYTEDGDEVRIVSWSASSTVSRQAHVTWFSAKGAESLGPCALEWVPTKPGMSPFANIVDATWWDADQDGPTDAVLAPQQLPEPTTRPAGFVGAGGKPLTKSARRSAALADDEPLDDLPF